MRGIIGNMEEKKSYVGVIRNAVTAKAVVRMAIISLVALMAWFQFDAGEGNMFALLKGDTTSLIHSARTFLASTLGDEKLSTEQGGAMPETDHINATWEFKKAETGESVWGVYAEAVKENTEMVFKAQVINGLKNITLVQNAVPAERAANNSMITGQEYSFLSADAVGVYAGKVKEANEKIQDGMRVSELSPDLQVAYQLANAPSYDFVYSLSIDTLHSAYQ